MTTIALVRLMKKHKLTQQAAADLMGVAQPTLHDIIHGHHQLTEKNGQTFVRGLARLQAMAHGSTDVRVSCAGSEGRTFSKRRFIDHLPECGSCLSRAFSGAK